MNRFARRVPQKRVAGNADLGERYDVGLLTNGFFHEAITQLRGDAGDRQIDAAEVAVVTTGGGHPGCAVLLTRG